ncbi:MAG: HlyC/CorC family transporter [Oscillospiraceae bacterium]|nr:HlyC/CorC family transporter [Oscillospiraceae bacterium]
MDDPVRWWTSLVICIAAAIVMAFFCACESAAEAFGEGRLKKLAEKDKRADRLLKLMSKPHRFVNANMLSRVFVIALISAVCVFDGIGRLSGIINERAGDSEAVRMLMYALSLVLIICAQAVLLDIFCIFLPRRLGSSGKLGEGFSLNTSAVYMIWLYLFMPLVLLSEMLSIPFLKLFGVKDTGDDDDVTEEEILMMVDAVNEKGALEESQAEMISNIFEFDDTEIGDVMTHRTEVSAIESGATLREAVELAIESGFSRIPVYKDSIDDIEGMIYAKDLLKLVLDEDMQERDVKELMRDVIFVPESRKCGELFKEFTEEKIQMAVVVDEYGGTAGVVTLEDLIETIVGSIQDEYDDETEEIMKVDDNTFDIEGNADYEDVMEALGKEPDEDSPFETIGAMVVELLGRIPDEGETPSATWENIKFTVLRAEDRKIERLRATILKKPEE